MRGERWLGWAWRHLGWPGLWAEKAQGLGGTREAGVGYVQWETRLSGDAQAAVGWARPALTGLETHGDGQGHRDGAKARKRDVGVGDQGVRANKRRARTGLR